MHRCLALFLMVSFVAEAKQISFDFKCESNPKTTSFILETSGEEMLLTTKHVNGVDFMPVHEGIITPHDLTYLTEVSTQLKHMGMQNLFRFPKSRCKIYGEGVMSCFGGNSQVLDGVKMQALSLNTQKVTTQLFDDKVESIKVILDVNIDGFTPVQEITMEYSPDDCIFSK